MEDEGPTPLDQLVAYQKVVKIKVRVCRIWRPKFPGMGDKHTGLHCILVDEKQQAIEASSDEMDYEIIVPKIEAGACYEIKNFRTNKTKGQYRVVPHDTHIVFTSRTTFTKLASVFPPIPRHRFFLHDYNRLYPRLNKVDILTDVIGHLVAIQRLEPIQINQRIDHKCDLIIQNIRNEEVKITLWSDVAHSFSSLSFEQLPQPIVIVFTSLKVKLFSENIILNSTGSTLFFVDPDITELNSYKSVFSAWPHPIRMLPSSSNQANETHILQTGKKVTIEELGYLDPDLYKSDTFLCKASIKRYNTRYEWWYAACTICAKQMYKDPTSGQLICQKHPSQIPTPWYKVFLVLEDDTSEINALIIGKSGEKVFGMACKDLVFNRSADKKQLPSEFLRLIGQRKIFHLRFGSKRNSLNSNDFLIYNVSEDISIQPATPQSISKEIVISSTTVSSSTAPIETTRESHKRKREPVRRMLFTNSEKSETEEISEAIVQDFDQVPIKLLKKKILPN